MATTARSPDYNDKTDENAKQARPIASPAPVLEPNEARGGATHHNVRFVLAISLAVIVVAFAIVYFGFFATSAPPTIPPPAAGAG